MGEGGGEVGMFLDMLSTEMAKGRDFEVLQAYLAAFLRIHEVALIGHEGLQVCTAPTTPESASLSLEDSSLLRYMSSTSILLCRVHASRPHHCVVVSFGGCSVRPRF
jgi:hypothetical protein